MTRVIHRSTEPPPHPHCGGERAASVHTELGGCSPSGEVQDPPGATGHLLSTVPPDVLICMQPSVTASLHATISYCFLCMQPPPVWEVGVGVGVGVRL